MNTFKRIGLLIIFLLSISSSYAGGIDKGFKSLKIANYFDAKQRFEKKLKKEAGIANYGLAIIYGRSDNPFHNYDNAYSCIFQADQLYYQLSEKKKTKYRAYGYTREQIDSLKTLLASNYYKDVILKEKTEIAFHRFTVLYPWADEYDIAISLRDSIAFQTASEVNTSFAFLHFCDKY